MKQIQLKLNADIKGDKKGAIITLATYSDGTIVNPFWRARLKDSALDNCCEIVKTKRKAPSKKPDKESIE